MKRCIINAIATRVFLAVLFVFSIGINLSSAQQEQPLFGPLTLMRTTGKPNEFTYSFNKLPGFSGPFRLIVINGEENGQNRISSAKVILNGVTVLHESQLNQKIEKLDLGVELADVNTLQAVIKSKPGGFIKVSVVGQVQPGVERVIAEASGLVGPAGGSVSLDDFAKVTLPELPARPELLLKVQKIESPAKLQLYYGESGPLFDAGPALPEMVKVYLSKTIETNAAIAVRVPQSFVDSLSSDLQVELYAEFVQIGANDEVIATFDPLGTSYDAVQGMAYANIPKYAFTSVSSIETRIIIGSGPRKRAVRIIPSNMSPSDAVYASPRETIPLSGTIDVIGPSRISSPLTTNLVVTSPFGPRIHPLTGKSHFHKGVDLYSNGDNVYSVLPGKVIASGEQVPCTERDAQGLCKTGYGYRVIIDHGNGLKSLYAHLRPDGLPAVGQEVLMDVIGKSDTSGATTGPHLHLEYLVDGQRVDPMDFIGQALLIEGLSVVALVNGVAIEETRRQVNSEYFYYTAALDLVPLGLLSGSVNTLAITVENVAGTRINLKSVPLIIEALPLRVTLTWDKYDTDVDLHVWDSLGNHSWYANLCGIPNGCLDRDDVDGFGPEIFSLTQMTPGVTYTVAIHYYSDHGHGSTTARTIVEQGTQQFGPYTATLSSGQWYTIGTFPK